MFLIKNNLIFIKNALVFSLLLNVIFNNSSYFSIFHKKTIEIDNKYKVNLYENDSSFFKYKTEFKSIAFYYPEYNNISYFKFFNVVKNVEKFNIEDLELLMEAQINLAKKHGIYGFAIYYDLSNSIYLAKVNNFFVNKSNFPFFLIWNNEKLEDINDKIIENLINNLKKYFQYDNYIKIREKPVLSISKPINYNNSKTLITCIREIARKKLIGELFIIYPFTGNFTEKKFLAEYDATYDFSKVDLFMHEKKEKNILHYSGIIYKNLILNKLNLNFSLFRSCYLDYKNFKDYNPEKFYIANKLIFEMQNNNSKDDEKIVFINSWNDYGGGEYLEPDENYGYASINSFSKSIFNLPFQNEMKLETNHHISIAIQIHVYYEDLLGEIINMLNLIQFKYDLFISTISEKKKQFIEKCLSNSNANSYEIKIFQNFGRDVFPFLTQMKKKYKQYKYICHIHTKKSYHKSLLGANWRHYLYKNLIGSEKIVSEVLFDFEKNEKLGFIFPEIYYDLNKEVNDFDNINFFLNKPNKKYMNFILQRISNEFKIGKKLEFPTGNMFWAKTKAIYQIFNIKLKYPKELNQTNETIMHGIERIWLYLVKLNGYYYKTIFKHY